MTQLNPGAIALRVIALTSAVTISACLVVSEQERADQAEQARDKIEALEGETGANDPLAAEQPLAGPPAPGQEPIPVSPIETFLHTSKAMMPPDGLDTSMFFPSSKSAVITAPPEIFMSTSKSLSVDPSRLVNPATEYEAVLRQRETHLMRQLEQVRAEIQAWKAQENGGR